MLRASAFGWELSFLTPCNSRELKWSTCMFFDRSILWFLTPFRLTHVNWGERAFFWKLSFGRACFWYVFFDLPCSSEHVIPRSTCWPVFRHALCCWLTIFGLAQFPKPVPGFQCDKGLGLTSTPSSLRAAWASPLWTSTPHTFAFLANPTPNFTSPLPKLEKQFENASLAKERPLFARVLPH